MPDRAVVGDENNWSGCHQCPHCNEIQIKTCQACGELIDFSQPRALVALSEDRQWLVVLNPSDRVAPVWFVYRWCHTCPRAWVWESMREDTGQDAADVLAAFLRDRQ